MKCSHWPAASLAVARSHRKVGREELSGQAGRLSACARKEDSREDVIQLALSLVLSAARPCDGRPAMDRLTRAVPASRPLFFWREKGKILDKTEGLDRSGETLTDPAQRACSSSLILFPFSPFSEEAMTLACELTSTSHLLTFSPLHHVLFHPSAASTSAASADQDGRPLHSDRRPALCSSSFSPFLFPSLPLVPPSVSRHISWDATDPLHLSSPTLLSTLRTTTRSSSSSRSRPESTFPTSRPKTKSSSVSRPSVSASPTVSLALPSPPPS